MEQDLTLVVGNFMHKSLQITDTKGKRGAKSTDTSAFYLPTLFIDGEGGGRPG